MFTSEHVAVKIEYDLWIRACQPRHTIPNMNTSLNITISFLGLRVLLQITTFSHLMRRNFCLIHDCAVDQELRSSERAPGRVVTTYLADDNSLIHRLHHVLE